MKSHFYVTVLGDSTLGTQQAEQPLRRAAQQTAQAKTKGLLRMPRTKAP